MLTGGALSLQSPLLLGLCVLFTSVLAQPPGNGNYRAASLSWRRIRGNTVEIQIQAEWRRSFTGYLKGPGGLAANGNIFIDDLITIGGVSAPIIQYGDGARTEMLSMQVTYTSMAEDWFRATRRLNHTYSTPNNGWSVNPDGTIVQGVPWTVTMSGCCRINSTDNDANATYSLQALIDLEQSEGSVFFHNPGIVTLHASTSRCLEPGAAYGVGPAACVKIQAATGACDGRKSSIGRGLDYAFDAVSNPQMTMYEDGTLLISQGASPNGAPSLFQAAPRLLHVQARVRQAAAPALYTEVDLLVHLIGRQRCSGPNGICDPVLSLAYNGTAIPYIALRSFPGVGYGWDPNVSALVAPPADFLAQAISSGAAGQAATGDVIAYAGYPVSLTFTSVINWCQAADDSLVNTSAACVVRDSSWLSFGPLPPGAAVTFHQADAIVDLLVTYDNPFAAHRPGQEWAVGRAQRDYTSGSAAAAAALQFVLDLTPAGGFLAYLSPDELTAIVAARARAAVAAAVRAASAAEDVLLTDISVVAGPAAAPANASLAGVGAAAAAAAPRTANVSVGLVVRHLAEIGEVSAATAALRDTVGLAAAMAAQGLAVAAWAAPPAVEVFSTAAGAAGQPYLPTWEEAARANYTRLPVNLNSGAGGAAVYLWYRKYDRNRPAAGQEAITHINVSASREQAAALAALGYVRVPGNLNEEAGGAPVHVWYRRSAGPVEYDPARPAAGGSIPGIVGLWVRASSAFPAADDPVAADPSSWSQADGNLNAGLPTADNVTLFFRRGVANPSHQTVTWTPCRCDGGRTHICASPTRSSAAGGTLLDGRGLAAVRGNATCVAVNVRPDALPAFDTPAAESEVQFFAGRRTRVWFNVTVVNPAQTVAFWATGLPPGAALSAATARDACAPAGAPVAGGGGLAAVQAAVTGPAVCSRRSREVVWMPAWNQGGLAVRVCVAAAPEATGCEPAGRPTAAVVCVTARVARCVYAMEYEQQLQEIAALYQTDWLNLYSLNPSIKTPDRMLYANQVINIGHLYQVVPGDTLTRLATRFGTSVGMMLQVNADLDPSGNSIFVGQQLCIIPDTCRAGFV